MFGTLWFPIHDVPTDLEAIVAGQYVACENVRFSSLFTAGDISHDSAAKIPYWLRKSMFT